MAMKLWFFQLCISWLFAHVFCCIFWFLPHIMLNLWKWTDEWDVLSVNLGKQPHNNVLSLVFVYSLRDKFRKLSTPSGRRSLSFGILCFILVSVPPSFRPFLALSLFLVHSLFLCQRTPDQSLDGCHGYQQSAAAAWVYFVVSWGEFKSCPFPEPSKPNLTTTFYPDLWNQRCHIGTS